MSDADPKDKTPADHTGKALLRIYDPATGAWTSEGGGPLESVNDVLAELYGTRHQIVVNAGPEETHETYEDALKVHVHVLDRETGTLLATINDHLAPHDDECNALHVISAVHPDAAKHLAAQEQEAERVKAAAQADRTPENYPEPGVEADDGIDHETNASMVIEGEPTELVAQPRTE